MGGFTSKVDGLHIIEYVCRKSSLTKEKNAKRLTERPTS